MIQYAAAFDLYFWHCTKRGRSHTQFNKLILFLKGITARHLMKIVEPLIIAIKGTVGSRLDTSHTTSLLEGTRRISHHNAFQGVPGICQA